MNITYNTSTEMLYIDGKMLMPSEVTEFEQFVARSAIKDIRGVVNKMKKRHGG